MFVEILGLYLQGLLFASIFVIICGGAWIGFRAYKKKDKTAKERQAVLYEAIMMAIITAPVLSFAFMGLILMLKA